MSLNTAQITEKLQLLEQRISKNGQGTIQRSFNQQQNIERAVEQPIDNGIINGNNNNNGYDANFIPNFKQENNHILSRNQENAEDEYDDGYDNINNNGNAMNDQQEYQSIEVMHKMEAMTEQPESLEQDDEAEILNEGFQNNNNNQIMSSFEEKNEQNIWNKDQNSSFGGQGRLYEESNDYLAPQEKLSNISSINNIEARDQQVSQQQLQQQQQQNPQIQIKIQQQQQQQPQQQQQQIHNSSFDSSDRHQQQQQFQLHPQQNQSAQQGITTNQSTGGGSSLGQQGNNYINNNNNIMQNSREKNQKSTAKKRKTTQTTLAMNKLKKYDTSVAPQITIPSNQNQMTNRQRLNSDSSNSNEALQLINNPPINNSKITEFFKKKYQTSQVYPNQNNLLIPSNLNSSAEQINQSGDMQGNNQGGNNNQKENINVMGKQNGVNGNNQQQQQQSLLVPPTSNNLQNASKKSNISNATIMDDSKPSNSGQMQLLQSPQSAQNNSINNGNMNSMQSNQPSIFNHQNHIQSTLKTTSSSLMMIVDPKLELKYNSLQEDLKSKELELNEKNNLLKYMEHDKKEIERALSVLDRSFQSYKVRAQKLVQQQMIEVEKLKREELILYLGKEKQRLGEYVQTRDCTKFDETWQEGTEFKKIKERLRVIEAEKEELERKKKNIKGSRKSTNEPDIAQDLDMSEAKQRINIQIQFLSKEENDLIEMYKSLEQEKFIFIQRLKRFQDEQCSRYGKSWPLLGERYQLLSLLGRGGFSEVYKAYDLQEFREVACKIHQLNQNWAEPSKANYIKHAVRESKIHSELKHPNIVQLYDTVEIDNNSFATILEYCEGPDLYFYLKKHKVLSEKEAKMLIKQILYALKYMNSQKTRIIHYDLKPQNIIFQKGELKISDFGLSKIFEDGQTRMELTSQGVGTYWYLPPETFEFENSAQISPKVDIWSVGVIFFEMVFGQRPFGNNKSQDQILKENIILKSTTVNFPSKPSVSNECKDFIRNCLTYDQNRRWDVLKAWDSPYMNSKTR